MISPLLRRGGLAVAAALAGVLATAGPAAAHGADAPGGTDYRTRVTAVTPARPGLTVRAVEAGARLELVNRTGRTIRVLGYDGEPYLEVRPDGVYENVHSPATYLNETLAGDGQPPADADPALPPSWRRVSAEPVARWHDRRTHWLESAPPAQVQADPGRVHRVRDWTVPLVDDTTPVEVRGTLDWLPPPNPYTWWMVSLLGVLVVGALGLVPAGTRAGRRALTALGVLLGVGGLAAVAFAAARQLDAGADGPGELTAGLLTGSVWAVLTGLAALAAGVYALLRRPAADFAVSLAGVCVALFAGVANAAVLARSVAPVAWSPQSARLAVALVVVTGAGVAAAGALRLHATRRATRPADHGLVAGDKALDEAVDRAP